jgi:sRNA-binding protein
MKSKTPHIEEDNQPEKVKRLTLKGVVEETPQKLDTLLETQPIAEKSVPKTTLVPPLDRKQLAMRWLLETFPDCFNMKTPKPLQQQIILQIYQALPKEGSFSKTSIRQTLAYYTNRKRYQLAMVQETHRINLQGEPIEPILSDHTAFAQAQLNQNREEQKLKHNKWRKKRKKQKNLETKHLKQSSKIDPDPSYKLEDLPTDTS